MIRNILVPTDFSAPANGAAAYALHIARYLKCNLELCHSFIVPADLSQADQVSWPLYDYDTLKENAMEQLAALSRKLVRLNVLYKKSNIYKPIVNYSAEAIPVVQLLDSRIVKEKPVLVVAGSSGTGAVTRFFAGSTTRRLIEATTYPTILVPPDFEFKPIRKIAFATDLDPDNIEAIHLLAGFAKQFDAEIVIVHVQGKTGHENTRQAKDFLLEMTSKINYDNILYRELDSSVIQEGLDWITENEWIDLLVMVHRQGNILDRIFKGSHTKRQLDHISVPMLVLPEGFKGTFGV